MQYNVSKIQTQCNIALETAGEHLVVALFKARAKSKRVYKYLSGKSRKRLFLVRRLDEFESAHKMLFNIIENGDIKDHQELYNATKHQIVITLKATRTLNKNKLINKDEVSKVMFEYIHMKRFNQKSSVALG